MCTHTDMGAGMAVWLKSLPLLPAGSSSDPLHSILGLYVSIHIHMGKQTLSIAYKDVTGSLCFLEGK